MDSLIERLGRSLIECVTFWPIEEHDTDKLKLLNAAIRWANENRERVLVEFVYNEELYSEV